MRTRILGLLAVGLLVGPVTATAALVTWDLRGTITGTTGGFTDFPDAAVGDSFQMLLTFDTAAALIGLDSGGRFDPGVRYRYDPSSQRAVLVIGGSAPVGYEYDSSSGQPGFLFMRDNSGDLPAFSVVDGFSAEIPIATPTGFSVARFSWFMRGSILDTINGPGLPATPDPRLADQEESLFSLVYVMNEQEFLSIVGDFSSVRSFVREVPEPGTLALLGLGLAGLGLSRRRRAN